MDIFYHGRTLGIILELKLDAREVPKAPHAAIGQTVGDLFGGTFRNGQNGKVHVILLTKALERVHVANSQPVHGFSNQCGIDVEQSDDVYAALFKHGRTHQRATQIANTDDDGTKSCTDAKDLGNFSIKIVDVIAVALLTEAAEAVEVLTDL